MGGGSKEREEKLLHGLGMNSPVTAKQAEIDFILCNKCVFEIKLCFKSIKEVNLFEAPRSRAFCNMTNYRLINLDFSYIKFAHLFCFVK